MDQKRKIGIFEWMLIVGLVCLLVSGAYYIAFVLPKGELGQGESWRILQSIDLAYRENRRGKTPVIIPRSSSFAYSVLGMPTGDEDAPFVWLILDGKENSSEPVQMMPKNMKFHISCGFVEELTEKIYVSKSALVYLRTNCISPGKSHG